MEKIQCNEMTRLIEKVRKGEDEDEDRSCDQKGFSGQRYMCRQLKNKWSKKVEAMKGRGSERYETK